ncbi:alpha-glucosidase [Sphingomonas sp. KR1UV-12]|uniref:Alpha-glucosidase n=1 Tax=Sphingomonas aurea TaxID=3063994 RepID=A0ABT9EK35_9SPHN|nr:alpha-glucosidase [Sphingomonas sp. KR1UV-12]MDP1027332.1 alpha-glucosidase [Sphingomonas sp. KR1UV-12]
MRKILNKAALMAAAAMLPAGAAVAQANGTAATPPTVDRGIAVVPATSKPWWQHAVIYEIYPRSFQDSNGDGVGDLRGITSRLDYLQSLGLDAIWITPFFKSPNADFGYDVSDYTAIDPQYGTMADWDTLVAEAKKRGIRVMVDLVVNHSSSENAWFKESRSSRTNPKADWYVWHDGTPDTPPTNWKSIFGGPTWTWDKTRKQWYYHIFLPQQPDLNWASPGLRKAMFDVVRFWLDHGAAGFRLDATPYLFEDTNWPQDPNPDADPVWLKPYNSQLPGTNQVLREMRKVVDGYPGNPVLLGESSTRSIDQLRAVYGKNKDEIHLPMNFLVGNITKLDAAEFKRRYDEAATKLDGLTPVEFFSNHDQSRQWSEFGDGVHNDLIGKMSAALTLLNPGTALLYYGEEIGMGDVDKAVLATTPLGPNRPRADERDRARTPMQWSDAARAGFTTGTPWLPLDPNYRTRNVAAENVNPASLLNWYRALVKLRRTDPAFRDGAYVPLESGDSAIFAFGRVAADGTGALVLANTGATARVAAPTGWVGATPVFGTRTCASGQAGTGMTVAPYDTCIIRYHKAG